MADNPSWQPILDALPESLHGIIRPQLEEWDRGVNAKLESVKAQYGDYDAYKAFVDQGIDPNYVMQSVQLADAIRQNPDEMVNRISSTYNLGYAKSNGQSQGVESDETDEFEEYDGVDITKHPQFQQVTKALEELQGKFNEDLTTRQERDQAAEFETYIKGLHDEHGDFDDIFVGAYLAQGYDPKEAVDIYRERIAGTLPNPTDNNNEQQGQATGSTPPPVVLDGAGTGSGTEQSPVNFGAMKKSDIKDFAEKFLEQADSQ